MKPSRKGFRAVSLALCLVMLLAVAAPAMAANIAGYGVITAASATVYSSTAKTAAIGTFSKDDVVAVETISGSLYKVRLSGSTTDTGYIDMSAISGGIKGNIPNGSTVAAVRSASGAATTTGVIYNCSSYVTFRGTASASGTKIGTLNLGTAVVILGEQNGYYNVTANGKTGFVSKDYVQVTTSAADNSATETESNTSTAVAATGLINASSVRMFKEAATNSGTVTTLNKSVLVDITAQTADFYYCKYASSTGYVQKTNITVLPSTTSLSGTGTVNVSSASAYKAASTSSGTVVTLNKNAKVTITGEAGTFYLVTSGSKTGYVEKTKITLDSSTTSTAASGNTLPTVTGKVKVMPGSSTAISAVSSGLATAKSKNSDTVGYIKIAGTNIDYPILNKQGDPFYYLNYDINKKKSSLGSIDSFYNVVVRNNVITGHNMRGSNRMLHQLHHLQEKALGKSTCAHSKCTSKSLSSMPNMATDAAARVWDISLFGYNKWEVWAMYEVLAKEPKTTLSTNTNSLNSYSTAQVQSWIDSQVNKSQIKFGTSVSPEDILMTIYTCGDNYDSSSAQSRIFYFLKAVK